MSTLEPRAEGAASATPPAAVGAVRAGAMLFAAAAGGSVAIYLFLLVAGRVLGPGDYGVLAALLATVTILSLPIGAVQLALAREVSALEATGRHDRARAVGRRLVILAGWTTVAIVVVLLAATVPLARLLQIDAVGAVAMVALLVAPTALYVVFLGVLQGRQEFPRLAAALALPAAGRLVLFVAFALMGWRLFGALVATAVAGAVAVAVAAVWCRDVLRSDVTPVPAALVRPIIRSLLPIAVALASVTALTNVDLLVVKGTLSDHSAGLYAAGSTLAKLAFFLPVAIVSILFPRVAARRARGEPTDDILGRALIVTVAFCVLLFGFYAIASDPIVHLTFGAEFEDAAPLLGLFGLGMTAFSVANVLVSYHLSVGRVAFAWIMAAAAIVDAAALAALHGSLEQVLWVNAAVGGALLVVHEVACGSSFPALRSGLAHFRTELTLGARARQVARRARDAAWVRPAHLVEVGAVLVGATGFAVFLTWPLALHLQDSYLGRSGDATGTIWHLWRLAEHHGFHVFGATGQDLTGAPFGWELGNWFFLQLAWSFFPAYVVAKVAGAVVAYNLLILSGFALSGAAMYLLVRRIGCGIMAASWATLVFMTFPWLMEKAQGHAGFVHLEGFPLLLLALLTWHRRPTLLRAVPIAAALMLLWLTSGYFGLIATVATAVALPIAAFSRRRDLGLRRALRQLVLAASTALGALVVVGGLVTLGTATGGLGIDRSAAELEVFGARWWEFLLPHPRNPFFGDDVGPFLGSHLHGSNSSETTLYVGWTTILLAVGWIALAIARRRRLTLNQRFAVSVLPALVVTGVIFSLPSPVVIFGAEVQMPARLLFDATGTFRAPTRFIALIVAALVPLAALGLDAALRRLAGISASRRAGAVTAAAACVAVGAISFTELRALPVLTPMESLPREYRALERLPSGPIAEYPPANAGGLFEPQYLIRQRFHGRALLDGGGTGSFSASVSDTLADPAAPGVASSLAMLGMRAIVVHPPLYKSIGSQAPALPVAGYTRLATGADGSSIWRVTAARAPAIATFGEGFGGPEQHAGGATYRWLLGERGTVQLYAPRAGRYRVDFEAISHLVPRRMTISGTHGGWEGDLSPATVSLVMELPAGRSNVEVQVTPGASPVPGGGVSVYMSNWTFSPADHRARSEVRAEPVEDPTVIGAPQPR